MQEKLLSDSPKTIDFIGFFKKFYIATRTIPSDRNTSILLPRLFSNIRNDFRSRSESKYGSSKSQFPADNPCGTARYVQNPPEVPPKPFSFPPEYPSHVSRIPEHAPYIRIPPKCSPPSDKCRRFVHIPTHCNPHPGSMHKSYFESIRTDEARPFQRKA